MTIGFSLAVMTGFIAFGIWAVVGRLDTFAVLTGTVVPVGSAKPIKAPLHGVVRILHVKNGDVVEPGAALVTFDPIERQAEREKVGGEWSAMQAKRDRLEATVAALNDGRPLTELARGARSAAERGKRLVEASNGQETADSARAREAVLLAEELTSYGTKLEAIKQQRHKKLDQVEALRNQAIVRSERVELLSQRAKMLETLVKKEAISRAQFLDKLIMLSEARSDLKETLHRVAVAEGEVGQLSSQYAVERRELIRKLAREYTEAAVQTASLNEQMRSATHRAASIVLRSPVKGVVEHIAVAGEGEFVELTKPLLLIIPDGPRLEIKAEMRNKDRPFVRRGQSARIKLEGLPFGRYGVIEGVVTRVSRIPTPKEKTDQPQELLYPVWVTLPTREVKTRDGDTVPIIEGMTGRVEVKVGKRSILEYMTDQWRSELDTALRER